MTYLVLFLPNPLGTAAPSFQHSHSLPRPATCGSLQCSCGMWDAGLTVWEGLKDYLAWPASQDISAQLSLTGLWRGWILGAPGLLPKFLVFLNDRPLSPYWLKLHWYPVPCLTTPCAYWEIKIVSEGRHTIFISSDFIRKISQEISSLTTVAGRLSDVLFWLPQLHVSIFLPSVIPHACPPWFHPHSNELAAYPLPIECGLKSLHWPGFFCPKHAVILFYSSPNPILPCLGLW